MQKHKILLVDDDPLILQTIAPALEGEGYAVTIAANGKEAIEWIERQTFDLILTDLVMDPVDGLGVLKKAKETGSDAVTIIITGFGDLTSAIDALRLDADDYLLKPCEPEEISFRVSSCLKKLELKRRIKLYENILPVCCVCKSIRDDTGKEIGTGEWIPVEEYLLTKAKIPISATYCPKCMRREVEDLLLLKKT